MSSYNDKAVALKYTTKNNAPVVVASGSGHVADKIVAMAESTGVPVYRDDSMTTMLSQLELGKEIPEELYSVVVDIYVYFLKFGEKV